VDDSGKGIAEADRARAFERFNRLGQRGTEGVGLGLSIVQMVAELHGGQVVLQDAPLGGLRVRVNFPGALRPAALPPNSEEKKT
jgi:signal transduction histidine kinase